MYDRNTDRHPSFRKPIIGRVGVKGRTREIEVFEVHAWDDDRRLGFVIVTTGMLSMSLSSATEESVK